MISLGHLSDLHATPVRFDGPRELLNKRFLGWLSWTVKRSKIHRTAVLDALVDDLHVTTPDQVVITGDLTNLLACNSATFVASLSARSLVSPMSLARL